jgi:membrane glycosyltransferase
VDPVVNALACASGIARLGQPEAARRERERLIERARRHGADALLPRQKLLLLNDPVALSRLHFAVWTRRDVHESWRREPAPPSNVIPLRAPDRAREPGPGRRPPAVRPPDEGRRGTPRP